MLFKRLRNLWKLSQIESIDITPLPKITWMDQRAEFIMPNRVKEIVSNKPDASLQDVIEN